MRRIVLLIALAVVLAACGGPADAGDEVSAGAPATTAAPEDGSAPAPTSTVGADQPDQEQISSTAEGRSFDGPPAPDFELALADGSTFRLSDEHKPVYVVFWAEW